MQIGFNSIHAFFLQFISTQFIDQSNAAAFLVHVEDQPFTFGFYHLHGFMQLLAAIAAKAAENITCKTTGMHSC